MAVYLIGFTLSTMLIAFTEKKQRTLFILGSVFALLIPCLIAALRSDNVGTDIQVYIHQLMDSATNAPNLKAYLEDYWFIGYRNQYVADYEYGFSIMVYVFTKLSHNIGVVLFAIQAITVIPIFLALARNRKKAPAWIGMVVYYLLFYNATLNAMRQWMAMGFLLLAFTYLRDRKFVPGIYLSVLSLLFHYSALIVVPIYAVYWIVQARDKYLLVHNNLQITGRTTMVLLISFFALIIVLNLSLVLNIMSAIGLDRFSNYLKGNEMHLMVNQIIMRIPIFVLFAANWRQLRTHTPTAAFYLAMVLLDVVAAQLISVDTFAFRIGQYFMLYLILSAPEIYACRKQNFYRVLNVGLLLAYALFYWYYTYVLQLRHHTIPYEFRIF